MRTGRIHSAFLASLLLAMLGLAGIRAGICAGISAGISTAAATEPGPFPSPEEARRLAAGEVLVQVAEPAGGGPGEGVGEGVIDAPPERVFSALVDFAHYREWMPFVARADAHREAGGTVVSAQTLHLPALMGDRSYRIRAVPTVSGAVGPRGAVGERAGRVWSVRWSYIAGSGNVVDTHGSWTVTELGGASGADASGSGASGSGRAGSRRSLVTCRMFLDPGRVSGWAMNRATRKDLPWIFQGLRQQVLRGRYSLH